MDDSPLTTRQPARLRARVLFVLAAALACAALVTCSGRSPRTLRTPRSFYMGFSGAPPRPDTTIAGRALDQWMRRADAGLIASAPQWKALLAGQSPESLVRADELKFADLYRTRRFPLIVTVDPSNGLDRAKEPGPLADAGRSLTEPAIQELYRRHVRAVVTLVRPEYLGLASETNLIRAEAPPALYAAIVRMANDAATEVRALDPSITLFATVQAETAWGRLPPTGSFIGIARDRADFPFAQVLGLSSYPYLGGFAEPESIPLDYYSRLVEGNPLPLIVIEGGWTSAPVGAVVSSPELQRRYLVHHTAILDQAQALGWFQMTFTDLDLTGYSGRSVLPWFAFLGLVDTELRPKPALSVWDEAFARPGQ
jgi:hypothetical protein